MRVIQPGELLRGGGGGPEEATALRLVTLDDASDRYVSWLRDPEVNRYLETRFSEQSLESVRSFVASMSESPSSYLFAILDSTTSRHIGNVKLGPINAQHSFADVSYFVGDRSAWGKGHGTAAVRLVTRFGFERVGLHRCQAGFYESHVATRRVLEKAGYSYEGSLSKQLRVGDGWEDHVWFGALRDIWH